MKKLKLLMAFCALFLIGGGNFASAYTVDDLTGAGWTKITTISQGDITDKYYVFVANDADLMLGLATSSNQSSTAAFYQALANPVLDAKKVWTLEANGENYAMRNLYSNSRQMQTEYSGSSNDLKWRTNDQTGSISWTGLGLAYSDDAWSLTSTQYNRPLGIYNNETGTPVEGKEIGANDAGKGQKFQIYAISRDAYWALAASSATIANPANFTGKISNQEIYNGDKGKMPRGWTENTAIRSAGNSNRTAGIGVTVLEGWTGSAVENSLRVDYYQNLTSLPVGVYTLTANGGDSNGTGGGKIYISSGGSEESVSLGTADADVETKKIASDGTLTIGLRANGKNSWVHANNFRLKYFGQTIEQAAIDIPAGGSITAGQWYKYSVSVTGNYTITAGSTTGFIQTTEGDQMVEDATGDAIETGAEVALTAGTTIYYKSSSDNTLTIEANIKTYSVGDVTAQSIANGDYINNLTTLVLTYGDAATNDGEASLAVIGSAKASLIKGALEIATGTLTADDAAKTLTATFAGVELVNGATDYSIVIPAGAFGYEGQSVNTEKVVAFNTGVIADGLYYFQKKGSQKYLGRGGSYGTEAVVADLGISFELTVQANGSYTFKNHDQSLAAAAAKYLNYNDGDGGNYTDQTAYGYTLEATEGGYYMRPDATYYMTSTNYSTDLDVSYDYFNRTTVEGEAIVWVPISKETYNSNIAAVRDAEAAAVATSAGISATTLAALKTAIASDFGSTDMTSSIKNAGCRANLDNWTQVKYAANGQKDFDANGTCGEVWAGLGGIKQSIDGLEKGLYKVSVRATWRPGGKESGNNAGNEINTNAWIYANTATSENLTQLKSWYSGGATIDNRAAMVASGDTYLNDVYVYVSEGETLTIGMASPTQCNGAWLPFFDWTLTYYEAKATPAEKEALTLAIASAEAKTLGFENGEYAPYNNVDALTKLAAAKAIDPETASGAAVVDATTALTGATWTANVGEKNAIYNGNFALSENDGAMAGWVTDHSAGLGSAYHARAFVLTSGMGNYDNLAAFGQGDATRSCAYFRFDGTNSARTTKYTYGTTNGYTMPLKTNTIYKLTAQAGGWGQVDKNFQIAVVSSADANVVAQNLKTSATGVNAGGSVIDYEMYFVVPSAGNYKLVLNNPNNVDNAVVVSNIELFSTDALEFVDGSAVPTYAPGTYPSVKITRTLTANKWATAVYPFAVSGVDNIAVLNSYNSETGALAFTSAAASTANEPFFMMSTTDKSEITLSNVEVAAANATPATANEASLIGAYSATDITNAEKNYVLSNNEIFSVGTDGATINPYRAYIQLSGAGAARAIRFVVDGKITGVDNVKAASETEVKDGKYLENGKIVIVKNGVKYNAAGAKLY